MVLTPLVVSEKKYLILLYMAVNIALLAAFIAVAADSSRWTKIRSSITPWIMASL